MERHGAEQQREGRDQHDEQEREREPLLAGRGGLLPGETQRGDPQRGTDTDRTEVAHRGLERARLPGADHKRHHRRDERADEDDE